jgi:hypothetical protein
MNKLTTILMIAMSALVRINYNPFTRMAFIEPHSIICVKGLAILPGGIAATNFDRIGP